MEQVFHQAVANHLYKLFSNVYVKADRRAKARRGDDAELTPSDLRKLTRSWQKTMRSISDWDDQTVTRIVSDIRKARRDIRDQYVKAWEARIHQLAPNIPPEVQIRVPPLPAFLRYVAKTFGELVEQRPFLFDQSAETDKFDANLREARDLCLKALERGFERYTPLGTLRRFAFDEINPSDSVSQVPIRTPAPAEKIALPPAPAEDVVVENPPKTPDVPEPPPKVEEPPKEPLKVQKVVKKPVPKLFPELEEIHSDSGSSEGEDWDVDADEL